MLEASHHSDNAFVTLTYDDEHLPGGGSLNPRDATLFLKRIRKALEPAKIRYFLVGEYGEQTNRPHYHAAVFGYPGCLQGTTLRNRLGHCCEPCDRLRQYWDLGHTYSGVLTHESAAYIAGYVVKKLTNPDDEKLDGKHPEYARMSRVPALGTPLIHDVASTLLTHNLETMEDVPTGLRHGSRIWPLGRTLRRKLRTYVGREERCPDVVLEKMDAEMSELRKTSMEMASPGLKVLSFKQALIDQGEGKRRRLLVKQRKKRGSL